MNKVSRVGNPKGLCRKYDKRGVDVRYLKTTKVFYIMENPKMIDEKEIKLLLKHISNKEILDAIQLSKKDMFRICRCVAPQHEKEWNDRYDNHKSAKDGTIHKETAAIISQMFLNCIWWETDEYDGPTFEGQVDKSQTTRRHKAVAKQCTRILAEKNKLENKLEKVMEEKGFITQQDLDRALEEQKQKLHEQMDQQRIENRKAYVSLQKRVADLKSNANYFEDIVDKQKIHIKYLENENADLIKQQTSATAPAPQ